MGRPVVQFQNVNHWDIVFNQAFIAQSGYLSGSYFPIPKQILPITLDKHILAVKLSSQDAKPSWVTGCWISQQIQNPATVIGNLTPQRRMCRLRETTLIDFTPYSGDYQLKLEVPMWIKDITIQIWQYIGPESDSTENLIQTVRTDLARIEAKIDAL